MQTVLRILERAGGYRPALYLRIENPPFMALVIEAVSRRGPLGCSALSVAHYGEQNGDLMRDPEMCFESSQPPLCGPELVPYYWRNDYMGVEQYSRYLDGGTYIFCAASLRRTPEVRRAVDRNLNAQGFLEAFTDKSIRG